MPNNSVDAVVLSASGLFFPLTAAEKISSKKNKVAVDELFVSPPLAKQKVTGPRPVKIAVV